MHTAKSAVTPAAEDLRTILSKRLVALALSRLQDCRSCSTTFVKMASSTTSPPIFPASRPLFMKLPLDTSTGTCTLTKDKTWLRNADEREEVSSDAWPSSRVWISEL